MSFSIKISPFGVHLESDKLLKQLEKNPKTARLLSLCHELEYDVNQIRQRDPAAESNLEVALLYSGFHAVTAHRLAHYLYLKGYRLTARALSQFMKLATGIEIHPGATIGKGCFIDHGTGVVIGETAEIGDNCTIYQGATLGGTGKDVGKRHPTLGNDVMVGAGARVLGPIKVGDNSKIAAGAVALKDIPANSTAVGVPAKVVRRDGEVVGQDLDQINIPDPVSRELAELRSAIDKINENFETKSQN